MATPKLKKVTSSYHGTHEYSTFSASVIRQANQLQDGIMHSKCCCCCCCLCRFMSSLILHPVGPFRCVWDMIVMLLLIYTSIEIPYTFAFGQSQSILLIGLFVDGLLMIDIFLNFHTAYFDKYDNLRLVTNKKYICKKYFRTWFFIDILTCIPFEFIFDTMAEDEGGGGGGVDSADYHNGTEQASDALTYIKLLRIFRLLRIIKILRFLKMLRIFDAFMKQFIIREVVVFMKLFKIIFGMLMFAHFAACIWFFVGDKTKPSWIDAADLRENDLTAFEEYSYAWYWAVVTLFTTGYGDIVATNVVEQWVSSICILTGTCFFAYFVGTLTVLITEGDKIKSYELEKLEEAQSFCEKKKLPKELTRAILTHIRYHCNYNYVFDENEILTLLPSYLQHDINSYVAKQFLLSIPIFDHLPDYIVGLIAVKSKSISCNQSYKLYDIGDIAKEFYIQRTGKSVMYDKRNKPLHQLTRGSVCGEYSSILFKKRKLKIECKTWSEFYSISIDDVKEILNIYFPKSFEAKWKRIKKYVKTAYKHNVKHTADLNNYADNIYDQSATSISERSTKLINNPHIKSPGQRGERNNYEDSVHLFNNTKERNNRRPSHVSRKNNGIPTNDVKTLMQSINMEPASRPSSPVPPDESEDDANDDIVIVTRNSNPKKLHSRKQEGKRTTITKSSRSRRGGKTGGTPTISVTNANATNNTPISTPMSKVKNNDDHDYNYYSFDASDYVYKPKIKPHRASLKRSASIPSHHHDMIKKNQYKPSGNKTKSKMSTPIKSQIHKFAKFQIRSNSELRNFVVVAHAEKHNKLSTPMPPSDDPRTIKGKTASIGTLQKFKSEPNLMTNGAAAPTLTFKASLNTEMAINKNGVKLNKSVSFRSIVSSGPDSECSFSSSDFDTDESMMEDQSLNRQMTDSVRFRHNNSKNNHRQRQNMLTSPKQKKNKIKRKKGKGGKFGKRGGRNGGGHGGMALRRGPMMNKHHHSGNKHRKKAYEDEEEDDEYESSDDDDSPQPRPRVSIDRQSSFGSVLLAPLGKKRSQMTESTEITEEEEQKNSYTQSHGQNIQHIAVKSPKLDASFVMTMDMEDYDRQSSVEKSMSVNTQSTIRSVSSGGDEAQIKVGSPLKMPVIKSNVEYDEVFGVREVSQEKEKAKVKEKEKGNNTQNVEVEMEEIENGESDNHRPHLSDVASTPL